MSVYIFFCLGCISLYFFGTHPVFPALFLLSFYLWDLCLEAKRMPNVDLEKFERERKNRKKAFEEYCKVEEEEKERKRKYSELGYGSESNKSLALRLAFHDRTGHATKEEKELLEILTSSSK